MVTSQLIRFYATRGLLLISFIFSFSIIGSAQTAAIDSLRNEYKTTTNDSSRFENYFGLTSLMLLQDTTAFKRSLDTLKQLGSKLGDPYYIARSLFVESRFLKKKGKSIEQRKKLEEALKLYEIANNKGQIATTQYALAGTWLPEGDFEEAFLHFQSALEIFQQIGPRKQEAGCYNALGVVQRRAGNLDEAVHYLSKAATLSRELNDKVGESAALLNQAIIHKQREEYNLAEPLYQRGLELAEGPPVDGSLKAYINNNLGSLYTSQKQYEKALLAVQEAHDYFVTKGNKREQAGSMLGIGINLLGLNKNKEAIQRLNEALELGHDELMIKKEIHKSLSEGFAKTGLIDSALTHLQYSNDLESELADEKRLQALAEVEARYQNKEKQLQIDALAAEDLRSQEILKRRNTTIIIGGILLLLLLLLLRSVMKQRSKISNQNKVIQKNLADKELLMKEIHHRVKNNLQMISSLLSLQSKHLTDSSAVDALQLGKSRVRSMAMIHQQLYTGEEVSTLVNTKEYLEQLCHELVGTYQPENTNIDLDTDIVAIELDIDTLIPLGLLVNEAATNSVKYAFNDRTNGLLQVSLQLNGEDLILKVRDDGPGFKAAKDQKNHQFGTLLMNTLADQLDGHLERSSDEKGTTIKLNFPKQAIQD